MLTAPSLSESIIVAVEPLKPSSCSNVHIHRTSIAVVANAMYSASTLDVDTLDCFELLWLIAVLLNIITYPVVDLRSLWSPAQSESQYTCIWSVPFCVVLWYTNP